MSGVIRIFVEKRDGFNVLAKQTLWDIRHNLGMRNVTDLRWSSKEKGYLRGKGLEIPFPLSVLSFGAFLFTQKKSGMVGILL